MNLFQKDLESIDIKLRDNKSKLENLNQRYNTLKSEKLMLDFSIYENNKDINKVNIMKNNTKNNYDKIRQIKKKKKGIFLIFILFEIFSLVKFGFLNSNIIIWIINAIGGFLVNAGLMRIYNNKIKNIKNKNKKVYGNLSFRNAKDNIDSLEKKKYYLLLAIKDKEIKMEELNKEIEKLNNEYAKLFNNYNIILEYYENVLKQLNVNESEEVIEEKINREHANQIPVIVKKLYGKK